MKKLWVVFYYDNRELLRYTLCGECDGEREATVELLSYENDIPAEEIRFAIKEGNYV